MAEFLINDLINKVSSGNLRIPSFQRDFVWDSETIAFLMDSIYKDYPFGSIQLWRTKEQLDTEKQLGPFELFKRDEEYPIDYVLDGQQRVTSIFGVFQTEIQPKLEEENPFRIFYDFTADENSQDSQFVYLDVNEENDSKYFPLRYLFDPVMYRKYTKNLSDEISLKVDNMQRKFMQVRIPYQTLDTNDKSKVAIVFERINRRGVPLDTLQLLTAWTWSESFDLKDKFEDLKDELKNSGFSDLGSNPDLLLRITSAILTQSSDAKSLIELNGNIVRERFQEVINGIKGAVDFLNKNLKVEKIENLPYEHFIIPLSVFFSNTGNKHFNYSNKQRKVLISWFWKSSFGKRYSAGTNKNLNKDIEEIVKLKNNDKTCQLDNVPLNFTPNHFKTNSFTVNTVMTKSFVLLLAHNHPKSFISGSNISLSSVLKDYNKNEFHHIYPKAYLKKLDNNLVPYSINCLANFCILSRAENKKIEAKKPSIYRKNEIPDDAEKIFESTFIDEDKLIADNYGEFIDDRAEKLYKYLMTLI